MKIFTGIIGTLCLLLTLGVTGVAMAQQEAGTISITPFVGGYIFDHDVEIDNAAAFGLGLGYNFTRNLAAEFVFNYINTRDDAEGRDVNVYLYHLDALYHFMPDKKLVPYLAAGIGGSTINPSNGDTDNDPMLNWGGGLKYFFNEKVALRGDIRHVMAFGSVEHNLLYTVGLTFLLGGPAKPAPLDSDGDGVYDSADQCPNTPAGVKVDAKGCPLDTDGDGVYDYLDKCPGTPAGIKVDAKGCPPDTDGDGVYDYLDKCPGTPSVVTVDKNGCPTDSDGDGVYDYLDKCPMTPAGVKVDSTGCPLDSDGDGVNNDKDQCPDTPEGATVNEMGCWVIKGVQFDSGKWNIKPQYYGILDQVVDVLRQNPQIKVEVQGHTDNVGAEAYNLSLSEKRANAIMNYFIDKGINKGRLTGKGYGLSRPIMPNDTEDGRAANRRVQLNPSY